MTKEEQWKREAEIKLDELDDRGFDFDNWSISDAYERGYCDCAEPREKRIADLEVTNKKISDECHKLVDSLEKKQKEIAELNKKLSDAETDYDKMFWQKNEIISNAKEIIKKLKALYLSPIVTKDDVKRQDEILEEAEKFINEVKK